MKRVGLLVGARIWRTSRRLGLLSGAVVGALFAGTQPGLALVINVTYPNPANVPAAAVTEINSVVTLLQNSFINNATLNITIDFTSSCGLGCSSTQLVGASYALWRNQMIADLIANPQNTFLSAAVATLPTTDPLDSTINGSSVVALKSANARALGFSFAAFTDSALAFTNDGVTFEYTSVATPGLWDFRNVFEHELDEALGIGSTLTHIGNNAALPSFFEAEDYFRYSSTPGVRSVTTNPAAVVFFSYNGVTDVAQFNQNDAACGHAGSPNDFIDRNDWINGIGPPCVAPPTPLVRDAIIFPGQVAAYGPGTPEFIALETLGYDPIPEPGTLALLGASLLGMATLRRRTRNRA